MINVSLVTHKVKMGWHTYSCRDRKMNDELLAVVLGKKTPFQDSLRFRLIERIVLHVRFCK